MGVFGILGYLALNVLIASRVKERPAITVSITNGLLILALYLLAMIRKMSWINGLWIAVGLYLAVQFTRSDRQVRSALQQCLDADMLTLLLILAGIYLLQRNRMATHWDEIGVWALETKTIYMLDGFSEQFCNTAIEFGDYYPGQMLFEAWFCSLNRHRFSEGLMFTGYYWLYISFLSPVVSRFCAGRRRIMSIPFAVLFGGAGLVLPGVVGSMEYQMLSVELLMSGAFGACLFACYDREEHSGLFVRLRCFSCTFLLAIFKETGLMYVVMALVFGLTLQRLRGAAGSRSRAAGLLSTGSMLCCVFCALAVVLTWPVYCRTMGRTSYFELIIQDSLLTVSQDSFGRQIIQSMREAIVSIPLTASRGAVVNLSAVAFWTVLAAAVVWMYRKRIVCAGEVVHFGLFYGLSTCIFLIALLGMHLFVFREEQYISPETMILPLERYGEPLFLGILVYLVLVICMQKRIKLGRSVWLGMLLCIAICTNWSVVLHGLVKCDEQNPTIRGNRESVYAENEALISAVAANSPECVSGRVLYVHPMMEGRKRMMRSMTAPCSVAVCSPPEAAATQEFVDWLNRQIDQNHCRYLFLESLPEDCHEMLNAASGVLIRLKESGSGRCYFDPMDYEVL